MVDSKDAENSISKTGEKASSLGDKLSGGIKTAAKWGTAIVGAASAVGGAMVAAAKSTASNLDVVDKASQRMGIAAESYQELAHAANLSGVEMSTLEKAAKKLEGTDLNMDDALAQIYELGTAEERSAKAAELFGESVAYQMTPMLNASAEEMAAMRKEANDLGLVLGEEAVKNGAAMNDMFSKVQGSISSLKNSLMAELMPYVMDILQWVVDNIPTIKDTVNNIAGTIVPIVKPVVDAVMQMLPPLLELIKNILNAIMPALQPVLELVASAVEAIVALLSGDMEGFFNAIVEMFNHLVDSVKAIGKLLFTAGKEIFTSLWDGIKSVWESIENWVSEKVAWLADKLAFWRSGKSEMGGSDGSHASGLAYVPYDGYMAELHRGETVLNSTDASNLLNNINSILANSQGGGAQTVNINLELDGRTLARAMYQYNRDEESRRGFALA